MQENKKNTLIINLIGAPSSGKSALMGDIFAKLKYLGVDCEQVTEFAKDLVWARRYDDMEDEIYIFAEQNHRLFMVCGKVDVIVTDRPLILTAIYNDRYGTGGKELNDLVLKEFNRHNNYNVFLNRVHKYSPVGRVQTEKESDEIAIEIKDFLNKNDIKYNEFDGDRSSAEPIVKEVLKILNKK